MTDPFTTKVIELILEIPKGKVSTYGELAKLAGNTKGAQVVAEILHLQSDKYNLPWQRVINAQGKIAFSNPDMIKRQRRLLEDEGIVFVDDVIDLRKYMYKKGQSSLGDF